MDLMDDLDTMLELEEMVQARRLLDQVQFPSITSALLVSSIGLAIQAMLTGSCLQLVNTYYRTRNDTAIARLGIAWITLVLLVTVALANYQQAMVVKWHERMTAWQLMDYWVYSFQTLIQATLYAPILLFFVRRAYYIWDRRPIVLYLGCSVVGAAFVLTVASGAKGLNAPWGMGIQSNDSYAAAIPAFLGEFNSIWPMQVASSGAQMVASGSLCVLICYGIYRHRNGFSEFDTAISKIVFLSGESLVPMFLINLLSLVIQAQADAIGVLFMRPIANISPAVFAHSLLTALTARERVREILQAETVRQLAPFPTSPSMLLSLAPGAKGNNRTDSALAEKGELGPADARAGARDDKGDIGHLEDGVSGPSLSNARKGISRPSPSYGPSGVNGRHRDMTSGITAILHQSSDPSTPGGSTGSAFQSQQFSVSQSQSPGLDVIVLPASPYIPYAPKSPSSPASPMSPGSISSRTKSGRTRKTGTLIASGSDFGTASAPSHLLSSDESSLRPGQTELRVESRISRLFHSRLADNSNAHNADNLSISPHLVQASPSSSRHLQLDQASDTAIDSAPNSADPLIRNGAIVRPPISPRYSKAPLPFPMLSPHLPSPTEWPEQSAVIRAVQAELAAARGAHGKWRSVGDVPLPWDYCDGETDEEEEDEEDVFAFTHNGHRSARSDDRGEMHSQSRMDPGMTAGKTEKERAVDAGEPVRREGAIWDMGIYEVLFRGPPSVDVKGDGGQKRMLGLF